MRNFKIGVVKFLSIGFAMLMLGTVNLFAQVNVTFPDVVGVRGTTGSAAIEVGSLAGLNVTSFQFDVFYDKDVVYLTGVTTDGTLLSGLEPPTVNADTANGRLRVAWAQAGALTGSGKLLNLHFAFRNPGITTLDDQVSFLFNAGTPAANVTLGSVTVPAISITGGDVTAVVGTSILYPISATTIVDGDNVVSYNFTASFNEDVVNVTGYELAGTLSEGGSAEINTNNTTGDLSLAWAKATKIAGTGVLLYIKMDVVGKGTSPFEFNSILINGGTPVAGTFDGQIVVGNSKPVFTALASQTVAENSNLTFQVSATDPDGDALTYTSSLPPSGASFTPASRTFSWTPNYLQAGVYTVNFFVSDGTLKDTLEVSITVTDLNRTPTLTLNPTGPYTVNEGTKLSITMVAADQDADDSLSFSGENLPTGATVSTVGLFEWTPSYSQSGNYSFTLKVTDKSGASATGAVSVTVNNTNNAPSFVVTGAVQMPDTTIREGETFTFTYKAIDPEGDAVTYMKVDPSPAEVSIDKNTGVFTWKPAFHTAGNYTIAIFASDGINTTPSRITSVTVIPAVGVDDELVPTEFSLKQNFPNPFNPSTQIKFGLPNEQRVSLKVYSVLGKEVATLVDAVRPAGFYTIDFDASNLASGIYLYKLEAGNFVKTMKMMLVK